MGAAFAAESNRRGFANPLRAFGSMEALPWVSRPFGAGKLRSTRFGVQLLLAMMCQLHVVVEAGELASTMKGQSNHRLRDVVRAGGWKKWQDEKFDDWDSEEDDEDWGVKPDFQTEKDKGKEKAKGKEPNCEEWGPHRHCGDSERSVGPAARIEHCYVWCSTLSAVGCCEFRQTPDGMKACSFFPGVKFIYSEEVMDSTATNCEPQSVAPTQTPTAAPTTPTQSPTAVPTTPTQSPTAAPTTPTRSPTAVPTTPTQSPTADPTTPTQSPTAALTIATTSIVTVAKESLCEEWAPRRHWCGDSADLVKGPADDVTDCRDWCSKRPAFGCCEFRNTRDGMKACSFTPGVKLMYSEERGDTIATMCEPLAVAPTQSPTAAPTIATTSSDTVAKESVCEEWSPRRHWCGDSADEEEGPADDITDCRDWCSKRPEFGCCEFRNTRGGKKGCSFTPGVKLMYSEERGDTIATMCEPLAVAPTQSPTALPTIATTSTVTASEEKSEKYGPRPRKKKKWWVTVFIAVAMGLAALLCLYVYHRHIRKLERLDYRTPRGNGPQQQLFMQSSPPQHGATAPASATTQASATTPTSATAPPSSTTPASSTKPASATKPTSSSTPWGTTPPTSSTKPASATKPASSTTPWSATPPASSATRSSAVRPPSATKPATTSTAGTGAGIELKTRLRDME